MDVSCKRTKSETDLQMIIHSSPREPTCGMQVYLMQNLLFVNEAIAAKGPL